MLSHYCCGTGFVLRWCRQHKHQQCMSFCALVKRARTAFNSGRPPSVCHQSCELWCRLQCRAVSALGPRQLWLLCVCACWWGCAPIELLPQKVVQSQRDLVHNTALDGHQQLRQSLIFGLVWGTVLNAFWWTGPAVCFAVCPLCPAGGGHPTGL